MKFFITFLTMLFRCLAKFISKIKSVANSLLSKQIFVPTMQEANLPSASLQISKPAIFIFTKVFPKSLMLLFVAFVINVGSSSGQTAFNMSSGDYSANFADIANWTNNFAAGIGASNFASVAIGAGSGAAGNVTTGTRTTKSSATFVTTSTGGIQKGTQALQFLSTGSTTVPEAVAVDLLLNFTGRNAGTISFDWAAIDNASGTRPTSLRVFYSIDNTTFTEIALAQVLDQISPATGSITNVALPSALNNSATARIRFYNHAGAITGSGNRDKFQIDNIAITSTSASSATITGAATATAFTTTYGTASTPQTFTVSGASLTVDITATAPTGYQVSSDGTTYGSTASFTQSGGTASGTLSVRLAATATVAGLYNNQNIVLSSSGATSVNITTAASGNIVSPKALTITGATASNKEYDGTTTATITGSTLVVIVGTDVVTVSGTGTFASANAGTAIAVTSTQTLAGANAANYTLTIPTGLTADISARPLTISGLTANNKVFDGTTTATLSGTPTLVGVIAADVANVILGGTYVADFASSAVGTGIAVTVTGYTISGSAAANYTVLQPTGLTADITATASPTITSTLTATETYGVAITAYTITATENPTSFNATGLPAGLTVNTATGEITGTATVVGTFNVIISATNAGGTGTATLVYTINQKPLTVTGATADNKIYNRLNTATISGSTLVGIVGADDVTISNSGTFASVIVGTAIAVTSTQTLSGADAAKYTVTLPTGLVADITPKALTIASATAQNKAFDGTTTATITGTLTGVISPDVVTLSLSGTFASAGAGAGIAVTSTSTISGADVANYTLTQPSGLAANITTPLVAGDIAVIGYNSNGAPDNFAILILKDLSAGTVFYVNDNEVASAGGTSFTDLAEAEASFTVKAGQTIPAGTVIVLPWGATAVTTATYDWSTTSTAGLGNNNDELYIYTAASITATTPTAFIYYAKIGTSTSAIPSGLTLGTTSIAPSSSALRYTTTNAIYTGCQSVLLSAIGSTATNWNTTGATTVAAGDWTFNVLPICTTISTTGTLSALSTTYGTASSETSLNVSGTGMTAGILATAPTGYELSLTSGGTFTPTVTIGAAGTIPSTPVYVRLAATATPATYSGNIVLSSPSATNVNVPTVASTVSPKELTITGAVATNKEYDATNSATITGSTLVGIVGTDVVTVNGTGTFASANVGTAIAVTSTQVLAGANAANYTLTLPTGLTADITAKPLTISGLSANNKVFDGTTTATLSGTAALVGVLTVDIANVVLDGTPVANFASAAVGTGIAVTVTGYTISGTAATNYALSQPTGLIADITATPTPVITGALTATETYGIAITTYAITATETPTSFNATGLPAGLSVNTTTGEITGTATVVGTFNVIISATNAGGTGSATLVYTINSKPLTVTGAVADNKMYDRLNTATISGSTLVGIVGTDDVIISNTGTFATVNAGTAIAVTSTQIISGADAAKYTVTIPTGLIADITPKALTIASATAQNKAFDGTTTATITGTLAGVISPDVVTLSLSGNFASAAVGAGIAVTSTSTITGADVANYALTQPTGLTANITTPLVAGDIAVIAYNTSGTPDNFTILVLKDLSAGSQFFVSDNEVTTAGGTIFADLTEGEASFTVKAGQTIPAGTVIVLPWGAAAVSTATYDWSITTGFGLNNGPADEIYIYTAPSITALTPTTFIYYAKLGGTSAVPNGLTLGTTAIAPNGVALRYVTTGALYTGCQPALLTAIGNTATNWNSTGATTVAAGDWTFNVLPVCTSIATTGTLTALSTTYGTASNETFFNVSGTGMTAGILVTAPAGYELSLTSGGTFTPTVTIGAAGTIPSTPVYVRLAATATPATYSGNIVLNSPSATNVNVPTVASTVSPKELTITGAIASNKEYDATNIATITGSTLVGIVGTDVVTVNGTGTFASANVGTAIAVTSTQTLAGANAANYSLALPTGLTADITAKPLTISGLTVNNKLFDGTTSATLSGTAALVGVIPADVVNVVLGGTPVANFATAAAGTGIAVVVTGYAISGTAATNYTLAQPTGLTANITASGSTAAILSGSATICTGLSSNLSVAITGGTAPFTIVYSDGSNNFTVNNYNSGSNISVSPTVTTTYSLVSVTDALSNVGTGNSGTAIITVNQNLTISASANTGGTITPSGTTTLTCGSSQTYTFSASSGYQILLLLVDGINNPAAAALGSYTFSNATGNHTIQAVFQTSSTIAQVEATTYRGAFAPAPTPMWTENWTNWDPQNAFYGPATVTVSGVISTNTTWTKNNVYKISGLVFVDSLVTLTIEAGTVIRGDDAAANSSLVVQRGGKLIANGTPCNPIVFTSNKAATLRAKADWGGVIILGRAKHNLGTQNAIEGIATTDPNYARVFHGGTDDADNSGSLKYVRIEFGGYVFAANNEINGLTMGSVGSGTTIDYVQTSFINDDAFEWFGGTVNCKHLVSYRNLDDDFDTDNGYSGTVQFGLAVRDPQISDVAAISTSEGFESDNNAGGTTATPKTSASFYNITQIGAFRCSSNTGGITQPTALGFRRGARLRRNTELKIFNSILMNNWRGLLVDAVTAATNQLAFKNNIVAMDYAFNSTVSGATGLALAGEDATSTAYLTAAANTNTIISTPCDVLVNAWDFLNPDYRPNGAGSGAALAGTDLTPGINIETALFTANQTAEVVVDIFENAIGNSNGTITLTIPMPSAWTVSVPGITTLSATPQSGINGTATALGVPYTNGDWMFSFAGGNVIATSKVGIIIPSAGSASLGFTIKRNGTTPGGTNQSLSATVSGGGDVDGTNNGALSGLGAN